MIYVLKDKKDIHLVFNQDEIVPNILGSVDWLQASEIVDVALN